MIKPLSKARFDLYVLGTRDSTTTLPPIELSFWSDQNETVIGAVIQNILDMDYGFIILCRDSIGRFRAIDCEQEIPTEFLSEENLKIRIEKIIKNEDIKSFGIQGDEPRKVDDILKIEASTQKECLNQNFRMLLEEKRAPAQAIIREISPHLYNFDPHFIKEFQQHQFDQRLWEIYLWAVLKELNFNPKHTDAPDFLCTSKYSDFSLEATVVSPSQKGALTVYPDINTIEGKEFFDHYMSIKFASSLNSKMEKKHSGKHYWELDLTKNKPFIIAISDFHKQADEDGPASMIYTRTSLIKYLYGITIESDNNEISLQRLHTYNNKSIESNFFSNPKASNISAIIFSNATTLSKFNRMGVLAGFGSSKYKYIRCGYKYNSDPKATNPMPFCIDITDISYKELWHDELEVFHNPNAKVPLNSKCFANVRQFIWKEGGLETFPLENEEGIISSVTMIQAV